MGGLVELDVSAVVRATCGRAAGSSGVACRSPANIVESLPLIILIS